MMGDGPRFLSTHWSVILQAKDPDSPESREAMEELIRRYWKPVYHFVRRSGCGVEDAKDLTQGFFSVVFEKSYLSKADPEHWRFRTFLRVILKRFLSDQRDRERAVKRGGDRHRIPLDFAEAETMFLSTKSEGPEAAFQREWARTVFQGALDRLKAELADAGKRRWFDVFRRFYGLDGDREPQRYAEIASELGMAASDVTNFLHRTRRRFREVLVGEIRPGLVREEDIDRELRELSDAF